MTLNINIMQQNFLIEIDFEKLKHFDRDLTEAFDEILNHRYEPFDPERYYDKDINYLESLEDTNVYVAEYNNQHHLIKDLNALQQLNSRFPYLSELIYPNIYFSNDDSFSILKQKLESNEFIDISRTF